MNGPVVPEARAALEKGDVTPILKWVRTADEPEMKEAFKLAVAVRRTGGAAKDLADRYFFETLVRVHRAGEGAPYTGLKDEAVGPIVALADRALAGGSADEMIAKVGAHMEAEIRARYARVAEARKHKDESVAAGREYVEAYVTYVHYVERVHDAIAASGGHGHAGEAAPTAPSEHAH
jgi:hypothetical protein